VTAVLVAHPFWRTHVALRDHLRMSDEDARAYERLKLELAERCADDREAYTDAKAPFVRGLLEKLGLG
jgi:GrpB-like predicted nucleotidyltransferase (UPF0157 family)